MFNALTIRDWRGIKHRLSLYTTAELANVLAWANQSRAQVDAFIEALEVELAHREGPPPQRAA